MAQKAVIVAAGFGSRFFPVTRAIPKEMLPILDRPAVDWVIRELTEAGITEIVVITSRRKRALEDWFDRDPELEAAWAGADPARLAVLRPADVRVSFVRQHHMGGTGDAILLARPFLGDEPFIVAFPDDLFGAPNCSAELIAAHRETGGSVLSTMLLPPTEDASRYGVLDLKPGSAVRSVRRLVEKPPPGSEPSREVSLGRYLFTPELFPALEEGLRTHTGGEYFHVPAINALAARGRMSAVRVAAPRYDTGTPAAYLRTVLEIALADPALGPGLKAWLVDRLSR